MSPAPVGGRSVEALPPYVANGVVGIRYPGLPHLPGTTMVNGFAGRSPADGVEGFARAPFALATDVQVDGVWASAAPEWTRITEQRYDFLAGELHTSWAFRVNGTTARVETLVFCPRCVPALAVCEITVRLDSPADMKIALGVDPTDVPGAGDAYAEPGQQGPNEGVDGRLLWHAPGDMSTLGVAYATTFRGAGSAGRSVATGDERGWFSTTYQVRASSDRPYRASIISSMVPNLSHVAAGRAGRPARRAWCPPRSRATPRGKPDDLERSLEGPHHGRRG